MNSQEKVQGRVGDGHHFVTGQSQLLKESDQINIAMKCVWFAGGAEHNELRCKVGHREADDDIFLLGSQ